jgi:hypothetical protein
VFRDDYQMKTHSDSEPEDEMNASPIFQEEATHCQGVETRYYERFEPITIRAAARVLHLQRAGVVSAAEAEFYLRELASMDAHAGDGAYASLLSAAQRRPSSQPVKGRRTRRTEGGQDRRRGAVIRDRKLPQTMVCPGFVMHAFMTQADELVFANATDADED